MNSAAGDLQDPQIRTEAFEGPLDLLCYLIEKNRINIYDIPIAEITDQYVDHIARMDILDMEMATGFLVMASTLLTIKSRMLLPGKAAADGAEGADPREELVIRLLEYRRCKSLADELRTRYAVYESCAYRLPESPENLGVDLLQADEIFSADFFFTACRAVADRNRIRFYDVSNRLMHILRRDRISLKEKMKMIWDRVVSRAVLFFNEIFPADRTSRSERVVGFLALLELLRSDRIRAAQDTPFDVIRIEKNAETEGTGDLVFEKHFGKKKIEEIRYQ